MTITKKAPPARLAKGPFKGPLRVRESCERWCGNYRRCARNWQQRQPMLKQAVYELPGRNVPLILCSNPARSGVSYLRWRNLDNNRSGGVALQEAIQQPDTSDELRDALMALEWRRQVLNTQLSVVMFMLRRIQPLTTRV
ncbi:Protein of uncharacterised function (DUF3158) [Citrobacter koseri]|nr:Protein of uncharacterised function (DUF3158) [Citrobacter koseri]